MFKKIITLFTASLITTISWASEPRYEQKFVFTYANIFASEASMLATAQVEAAFINQHLLASQNMEIVVDHVQKSFSVHSIEGRLKGKNCRVDLELYRRVPAPKLRRAMWVDMVIGVGIVWPLISEDTNTHRSAFLLVPTCY